MLKFYAFQLWEWLVAHGIPLSALIIIAILIPRVGRLAIRIVSSRFDRGEEATKSRLALVGALVYVVQAIAYFAIIMLGLTNLGVPAMGAALPATVVSAAIGFGAQNVIGDFLAGFFIISERQFGVGDFVAFDGTSSNISGTVVARNEDSYCVGRGRDDPEWFRGRDYKLFAGLVSCGGGFGCAAAAGRVDGSVDRPRGGYGCGSAPGSDDRG